jgi:hypothetical protein
MNQLDANKRESNPRHITIPLHTDRIKLVDESEMLLAAGERGR